MLSEASQRQRRLRTSHSRASPSQQSGGSAGCLRAAAHTHAPCRGPRLLGRAKDPIEVAERLGRPTTPAPGGNCEIPSFAAENARQGHGATIGVKLKDRFEIDRALGILNTPGPGAFGSPPSFVDIARQYNKGARLLGKLSPPRAKENGLGPGVLVIVIVGTHVTQARTTTDGRRRQWRAAEHLR